MIRLIRAFLNDGVSWMLAIILAVTLLFSVANLFNRYDRLDVFKYNLWALENDIVVLHSHLDEQKNWMKRLESDPMAWEQVARDKMNFLGPNEVLVKFRPAALGEE